VLWIRVETALLKREYKEAAAILHAAAAAAGGWIEKKKEVSSGVGDLLCSPAAGGERKERI
jgi:hypothetical protein